MCLDRLAVPLHVTASLASPSSSHDWPRTLAARTPVPQWAADAVLGSSDLAPSLFVHLGYKDGAAAAVCAQWRDCWKASWKLRRTLHRRPTVVPQQFSRRHCMGLCALPDFGAMCVAHYDDGIHTYDATLQAAPSRLELH